MTQFASFSGLPEPVALPEDPALVVCLRAVMNGWRFDMSERDERLPFATIDRRRRRYRLASRWLDAPSDADTRVGAVTSLVVDLGYAFAAAKPGRLCLHAGAAEFAGRLVVFPSASKAGKSTLIAALAMAGVRIFADDLLAIEGEPVRGIALGTRPRLRLPLPRAVGAEFRRFVRAHAGPADEEQQFLNLPPELHAAHSETAPLGAFVLLDRQPDGAAALVHADAGVGLKRMILQNLATPTAADVVFDRLRTLVEGHPCFTLRYARADDAVALLRERFSDWAGVANSPTSSTTALLPPPLRFDAEVRKRGPVAASTKHGGDRFIRSPAASLHEVAGATFIVHPGRDGIYALDPVARLVWALLEQPTSRAEIVAALAEVFPGTPADRIAADVGALMADLRDRRLALPVGADKKGAPRGRPSRRTEREGAQTE
jgi:hypothetical protein